MRSHTLLDKLLVTGLALLVMAALPIAPTAAQGDGDGDPDPGPIPDLIIDQISVSVAHPADGEQVTFSFQVRNIGDAEAMGYIPVQVSSESRYHIWYNTYVQDLPAGANETVSFNWTAREGIYSIRFTADTYDYVTEYNETNNVGFLDLTVGDPKPDLQVFGPLLVPAEVIWEDQDDAPWRSTIREGDAMTLIAGIENEGTAPASDVLVRTYLDDTLLDEQTVQPDRWGDYVLVNWTATLGDHTFRVEADPLDQVDEKNETNNDGSSTITVLTLDAEVPDLTVISVSVPESASPGDWVEVGAVIGNTGNVSSPAFDAYIRVRDVGMSHVRLPGLGPGEEATLSVQGEVATVDHGYYGDIYWNVVIDPFVHEDEDGYRLGGEVPEDNETNNYAFGMIRLLLPDLVIRSVEFPDGPYRRTEMLTVSVEVANDGLVESGWTDLEYQLGYHSHGGQRSVPSLAPGASYFVNLTTTAGSLQLMYFRVDDDRRVIESNEYNNWYWNGIDLSPDVAIASLTHSDDDGTVWSGEAVTFEATIENRGTIFEDVVQVHWFVDGHPQKHEQVYAHDGDNLTSSFRWTPLLGARYGQVSLEDVNITVQVRPVEWDADWDNNEAWQTMHVQLTPLGF